MLSGQQVAAVRQALEAGVEHKVIAAEQRLSLSTIEKLAKRLGLQRGHGGPRRQFSYKDAIVAAWSEKKTSKQLAAEIGCHPKTVLYWLREARRPAA